MVGILPFLVLVVSLETVLSFSYLESLSSSTPPAPEPEGLEKIAPEEYYGCTNPMANNWAGSKHQKYGDHLTKLSGKEERTPPDEWYGKSNAMASWAGHKNPRWGGYLDNLQKNSTFEEGNKSD
jgi:hypothetical protein